MDDGTYSKYGRYIAFAIDKKNFTPIANWFSKKYGVVPKLLRNHPNSISVRFNVKDSKKILRIIKPFIHPSMKYKTEITLQEKEKISLSRRKSTKKYRDNHKEEIKRRRDDNHARTSQ